jgi:uncharacterized protein involved in exopolysaccharide biosynthesis
LYRFLLTIRFLFFLIFFVIGAGAMVVAILAEPELKDYFTNREMLARIEVQNEKIKALTEQYAAQVELIESEPNILHRFSVTTFGHKPTAPDTIFPEAKDAQLRAEAEKLLAEQVKAQTEADPIPAWLGRILDTKIRRGLFLTGCGLVLVTFIFFGSVRQKTTPATE